MAVSLPPLPYAPDALAPALSAQAVRYHYEHHHAGYVATVNRLVRGRGLDLADLDQIIAQATGQLANAAAQVWNHNLYWNSMLPGDTRPEAALARAIDESFGSRATLARRFKMEGEQLFGSGWVWLAATGGGALEVVATPNAGLRLHEGDLVPLMVCDVWEHAYYADYGGERGAYLNAFWRRVNWRFASRRYASRRALRSPKARFRDAMGVNEPMRRSSRTWHPKVVARARRD